MKLATRIAVGVLAVVAVAAVGFGALYASRIQTANSIEKLTDYDDYNLYCMQIRYDYDLDKMIANTTADNQSFIDAAVKQALPLLPVSIKAPILRLQRLPHPGDRRRPPDGPQLRLQAGYLGHAGVYRAQGWLQVHRLCRAG